MRGMEAALKVINQMAENSSIHNIAQSKIRRRKRLSQLPVEEKTKILVDLQKMAAPILDARGIKVAPWKI